ncbi:MAG: PLP-dependent aminotransferase family protein, partial [Myxococcota bacterium]
MTAPLTWSASSRILSVGKSDVAAILKLAEQPEITSFAGGLPDPATFLTAEFAALTAEVMSEVGAAALGYSPSPGLTPMREWLAERMSADGRATSPDEIVVTTGGIAALDLIVKCLVDPGEVVVVGEPAYLAALHVFRSYRARLCGVPVDEHGMDPDALASVLGELARRNTVPRLLYLVPSFQNPSGATIPIERRRRILAVAAKYGVPIVEDAAYRDLRLTGTAPPLFAALAPEQVIFIHTFSKFFAPGVRLGWIAAPRPLIELLVTAKQVQDQCSSTISQYVCCRAGRTGLFDRQLQAAIARYARKRQTMLDAMDAHLPDSARWTRPEGGFYTWVTLPDGADTDALLSAAIEREKIAFVPGSAFFHHGRGQRYMRLCYSF